MDSSVGHFGTDKRTSLKYWAVKMPREKECGKSVGVVKKLKVFRKQDLATGTQKHHRCDLVPASIWCHNFFWHPPDEENKDWNASGGGARQEEASVLGHLLRGREHGA